MTKGARLRAAREARGLSQPRLAAALHVKQPTISRWESDKDSPKGANLQALLALLEIDYAWYATGSGMMYTPEPGLTAEALAVAKLFDRLSPGERDRQIEFLVALTEAMRRRK